jgi:hypothetical protein
MGMNGRPLVQLSGSKLHLFEAQLVSRRRSYVDQYKYTAKSNRAEGHSRMVLVVVPKSPTQQPAVLFMLSAHPAM